VSHPPPPPCPHAAAQAYLYQDAWLLRWADYSWVLADAVLPPATRSGATTASTSTSSLLAGLPPLRRAQLHVFTDATSGSTMLAAVGGVQAAFNATQGSYVGVFDAVGSMPCASVFDGFANYAPGGSLANAAAVPLLTASPNSLLLYRLPPPQAIVGPQPWTPAPWLIVIVAVGLTVTGSGMARQAWDWYLESLPPDVGLSEGDSTAATNSGSLESIEAAHGHTASQMSRAGLRRVRHAGVGQVAPDTAAASETARGASADDSAGGEAAILASSVALPVSLAVQPAVPVPVVAWQTLEEMRGVVVSMDSAQGDSVFGGSFTAPGSFEDALGRRLETSARLARAPHVSPDVAPPHVGEAAAVARAPALSPAARAELALRVLWPVTLHASLGALVTGMVAAGVCGGPVAGLTAAAAVATMLVPVCGEACLIGARARAGTTDAWWWGGGGGGCLKTAGAVVLVCHGAAALMGAVVVFARACPRPLGVACCSVELAVGVARLLTHMRGAARSRQKDISEALLREQSDGEVLRDI
jgi:hypothetical protein